MCVQVCWRPMPPVSFPTPDVTVAPPPSIQTASQASGTPSPLGGCGSSVLCSSPEGSLRASSSERETETICELTVGPVAQPILLW